MCPRRTQLRHPLHLRGRPEYRRTGRKCRTTEQAQPPMLNPGRDDLPARWKSIPRTASSGPPDPGRPFREGPDGPQCDKRHRPSELPPPKRSWHRAGWWRPRLCPSHPLAPAESCHRPPIWGRAGLMFGDRGQLAARTIGRCSVTQQGERDDAPQRGARGIVKRPRQRVGIGGPAASSLRAISVARKQRSRKGRNQSRCGYLRRARAASAW